MYEGIRTYENGTKETEQFDSYQEMVKWLAVDLEAGVAGYKDGEPLPQGPLTDDIQAWCS